MQMRPDIQLATILKALKETILPAVDPNNKLATEQGQLVVGFLYILSQHLDLQYRYDRDELERTLGLAALLQRQIQGGPDTKAALQELSPVVAQCANVLDLARVEPSELVSAIKSLQAKLGALIQAVFADGEPAARQAMREGVLANAKEQILRERSWMIMQGWEADPAQVPPIESLLREVR